MNAEALVGTVLGTSTLQQLIGQGGMGAVYLAQQSRPRRQVAVKVLMPATSLKPHQLTAFLERFRRETDAAASLEHPNIMPVYEYGERGGLAYLVMPFISAGTLRDIMERDGPMAFSDAVNYIEQMAAALDFAHARGVIHRDIKPANMLLTPENRLMLTDFGLVKLLSDNQAEQIRLTGAGAPVGTPDYMSPEQVIGGDVDGRSDQYSLGVVLYQMLTATTPFQGETPMQIASQQLHMQPPAPRTLRQDLPEAAEQVILRAMAKNPGDRFTNSQAFASAFRAALASQSWQGNQNTSSWQTGGTGLLSNAGLRKGSLFDPRWQNTGTVPAFGAAQMNAAPLPTVPTASLLTEPDSGAAMPRPGGMGLLSKTGLFPRIGDNTGSMPAAPRAEATTQTATGLFSTGQYAAPTGAQQAIFGQVAFPGTQQDPFAQSQTFGTQQALFNQTAAFPGTQQDPFSQSQTFNVQQSLFAQSNNTQQQAFPTGTFQQASPTGQPTTNALMLLNGEQRSGNTIKLTGPVKVVQVPVAPGQYVTGLLPVQKEDFDMTPPPSAPLTRQKKIQRAILFIALLVILIGGIGGGALFMHSRVGSTNSITTTNPANPAAAAMAEATATATSNILFFAALDQNRNGFTTDSQHFFKNNAYHILDNGSNSVALIVDQAFPQTNVTYSLTMQEVAVANNDQDATNTFGLVLRYNQVTKSGKQIQTFYTFEIRNQTGSSQYDFYKYDSSQGSPWNQLWHANAGNEFHSGHDAKAINTVKVAINGGAFTFFVNGKQVGTTKDTSYASGKMGMIVNLKGTEIAFSNMLITQ